MEEEPLRLNRKMYFFAAERPPTLKTIEELTDDGTTFK